MIRKKQIFSEQKSSLINDENFTHNLGSQINSENITDGSNTNLFKTNYCLTLCLEVNDIQLSKISYENDYKEL